ncbi:hypothetical protein Tco_0975882 [Tanacetum coccineum]|uniref:Uncharacterized protein n=1 Tax=Tanacetum coccineum TaxID=301880 RepID=A0ABQ5EFP2_9ASTR
MRTYLTSVSEDDLYMGSPGVEVPIYEGPPSPDYVPGPEEPEQAPPSPIYIPFVPEPVYPCSYVDDEVFRLPDIRMTEERMMMSTLAPAEPEAVAYSACTRNLYIAYRATARMSIRTQAPTPFLSEEVAERVLALPTPPPSPLSPYSSPLPQIPSPPLLYLHLHPSSLIMLGVLGSRAAGIDWEMRTISIHESVTNRDVFGPTSVRKLYGFTDMLVDASGRPMSELDDARYDRALLRARVNMLESDRPFHGRTAILMEEEARLSRAAWAQSMDVCDQTHSEGILLRMVLTTAVRGSLSLRQQTRRRQTVDFRAAESRLSEAEAVSRDPEDSEEPQGSDDRVTETAGTC